MGSLTKDTAQAIVETVQRYVRDAFTTAAGRIEAVEKRLQELAAREPLRGEKGEPGERGERGEKGLPGERGEPGSEGRPGERGAQGERGEQGAKGADAAPVDYDRIAVMIRDAVAEAVAALPKPADGKDGRDGIDGKDGAPGERGEKGDPGRDGKDGAPGERGEKGIDGRDGRDGKDGRHGVDGIDGKDAAELVFQMGMDEAASYPQGTLVQHRGGVFRAFRTTDPVEGGDFKAAGWSVLWQGVADARGDLGSDSRTFLHTLELTDGKAIVSKIKPPAMLFRGVFKLGTTYERGDVVSWGGNAWHAKRATSEKPGDESPDWEIAARRGRDGKGIGEQT